MALPHFVVGGLQCVIVVFPDHTHLLFDNVIELNELKAELEYAFKDQHLSCHTAFQDKFE